MRAQLPSSVGTLQQNKNMTPSGDVAQAQGGMRLLGRRAARRFTTMDIGPLAGGQPGRLGTGSLGVVIGRAPKMLEMNPSVEHFCSVKQPALVGLVQPISERALLGAYPPSWGRSCRSLTATLARWTARTSYSLVVLGPNINITD